MKIKLDKSSFNQGLEKLKSEYKILAPKTTPFKGTFSDTDITKYEEISTIEEIEFNKKSNFSAKETILPITQVLFYFTEKEYKTSDRLKYKFFLWNPRIKDELDMYVYPKNPNITISPWNTYLYKLYFIIMGIAIIIPFIIYLIK